MKYIVIFLLACIAAWQGVLLYFLSEVSDVIEAFATEPGGNMLMLLSLAQPILMVLIVSTLIAIYDAYHRNNVLVLNSIVIVLLALIATASCQILSILVGYGPIFELGNGQ